MRRFRDAAEWAVFAAGRPGEATSVHFDELDSPNYGQALGPDELLIHARRLVTEAVTALNVAKVRGALLLAFPLPDSDEHLAIGPEFRPDPLWEPPSLYLMPSTEFLDDAEEASRHVVALPAPLAFMSGALARSWRREAGAAEVSNCLFAWLTL